MKSDNIDIQTEVTNKILFAIEAGVTSFQMPWHQTGLKPPKNYVSGNSYRGANFLSLLLEQQHHNYSDNHWATFKQWREQGATVKKGERGTPIVFYKLLPVEKAQNSVTTSSIIPLLKYSHVFNVSQIEGLECEVIQSQPIDPLEEADRIIAKTGAIIRYQGQIACYRPATDEIIMPPKGLWTGTDSSTAQQSFYSVLLHETCHWTGALHRLDRESLRNRSREMIAIEELVAELGAAFACVQLGITATPRQDHANYIASWIEVLKSDKRAIFQAAAAASRAVEYIIEGPRSHEVRKVA